MENKNINIAILGFGTIGSATYNNIYKNRDLIAGKTGLLLNVVKVLEKEPELFQGRVFDGCEITSDFSKILKDKSISIVVELMGGTTFAKECVLKLLAAGKHVVTANKALIAENISQIHEAVLKSKASFFFEGAVAGGIPVIAAIKKSFAPNEITKIESIVNGTCNYILTEMSQKGIDFPVALEEAKNKGYAEADPAFDIEGIDAAHKIVILAALAFKSLVKFKDIKNISGITKVSKYDIKMAREMGYEIKLIASTEFNGDFLDIRVGPCLVNEHHPLSSVEGVYNAVFIEGFPVGKTMFYGRGAGGDPTSSAVISDILMCASECVIGGAKQHAFYEFMDHKEIPSSHKNPSKSRFYMKIWAQDCPGVLAKIAGVLGRHNISIASVIQKTFKENDYVPVYITTHHAREWDLMQAIKEMKKIKQDVGVRDTPFTMRIID